MTRFFYQPENMDLRRYPWVTLSLIAILTVLHLFNTLIRTKPTDLAPAMNYKATRPFLESDPLLDHMIRLHPDLIYEILPKPKPSDPAILRQQQAALDLLYIQGKANYGRFPVERWAFFTREFNIPKLFTHFLFHESTWHLALGLIFFYVCGPFLEDRWGRLLFSVFLVGAGMVTVLTTAWLFPRPAVYLYGFTGIAGAIIGAYAVRFRTVPFDFGFAWFRIEELRLPAPLVIGVWTGFVFLYGIWIYFFFPFIGVLAWHHVWGILIGAGIAGTLEWIGLEKRWSPVGTHRAREETLIMQAVEESLRQRRKQEALALLAEGHQRFPDNSDFRERYWSQAVRMGEANQATLAGIQLVMDCQKAGRTEDAYFHWSELAEHCPWAPFPLENTTELAHELYLSGSRQQAIHVLGHLANNLPAEVEKAQMEELGDFAMSIDPGLGLLWNEILQKRDDWTSPERVRLEKQAEELKQAGAENARKDEDRVIEISPDLACPEIGSGEDPFAPTRIETLKIYPAHLKECTTKGISLEVAQKGRLVRYEQVKAVSVAAIREIGAPAYLLLDLHLDGPLETLERHRVLRARGKRINPKALAPGIEAPSEAVKHFLTRLLEQDHTVALPDRETLIAEAFPSHSSLADFEAETYGVRSR